MLGLGGIRWAYFELLVVCQMKPLCVWFESEIALGSFEKKPASRQHYTANGLEAGGEERHHQAKM